MNRIICLCLANDVAKRLRYSQLMEHTSHNRDRVKLIECRKRILRNALIPTSDSNVLPPPPFWPSRTTRHCHGTKTRGRQDSRIVCRPASDTHLRPRGGGPPLPHWNKSEGWRGPAATLSATIAPRPHGAPPIQAKDSRGAEPVRHVPRNHEISGDRPTSSYCPGGDQQGIIGEQ